MQEFTGFLDRFVWQVSPDAPLREPESTAGPQMIPDGKEISSHYIEFRNVFKTFDNPVLVDVSFHVNAGRDPGRSSDAAASASR